MRHLLVVFLVIVSVGCAHHREVTEEREIAPNKTYLFKSKNQREMFEREALAGDNDAARRIADYYYFSQNDRGTAIWWLKLAASRGDATAKENLKKIQQE